MSRPSTEDSNPSEVQPKVEVDFDSPLASRQHRIKPPRHVGVRLGRFLGNTVESWVARHSVHPDVAVYDSGTFSWAARVEKHWRAIREELDVIMARRDAMPSFHEILSEAGTITTDNQWKTFFLLGLGMDCRKKPGAVSDDDAGSERNP